MGNWIFLRGLTRESQHWGDFVALFQHTLQAGQVMALDLPGNGRLNQQRSPLQVHDMVEHCRAELAARHLAPPYQVLAMSLGAMVALAWADAYPARDQRQCAHQHQYAALQCVLPAPSASELCCLVEIDCDARCTCAVGAHYSASHDQPNQ